jgi:hypothetical protein
MRLPKLILLAAVAAMASASHARQAADLKADQSSSIEAGTTITFTVRLDRPPNIETGGVTIRVAPVESYPNAPNPASGGGAINAEKTLYKVPVQIPVTARSGAWHVTGLSIGVPQEPDKQLKFNDVVFRVREREHVILPDSGSIEISK